MLILGRKVQESFYINGEEIIVNILQIEGNMVSIGIDAPKHISICREEIYATQE